MDEAEIRKTARLERRHWWYAGRRAVIRRLLRRVTAGAAIDVGAGGGGNAALLQSMGWRIVATDVSEAATESCRARGLPTVQADGTRLPIATGSLDLVLSTDTWEHVADDRGLAEEAARVLRPGGLLVLTVPADMRLWSGHDIALGHVRRYERDDLVRLVRTAGFGIESVHSWNVLLRPVARFRRRGNTGESDLKRLNPLLNAALRLVVTIESLLPVGRLRGVSLVLVARRL